MYDVHTKLLLKVISYHMINQFLKLVYLHALNNSQYNYVFISHTQKNMFSLFLWYHHISIFGINGKIDSLSDSDDFGEELIYSQESPKMEESFKTLTGIWIVLLSTDRLSQEKKHYQLKNQFRFRVGTKMVFDLKWES